MSQRRTNAAQGREAKGPHLPPPAGEGSNPPSASPSPGPKDNDDWPAGMEMIRQAREALGLFAGALPVTPKEAWEEALDRARRLVTLRDATAAYFDDPMEATVNPVLDALGVLR